MTAWRVKILSVKIKKCWNKNLSQFSFLIWALKVAWQFAIRGLFAYKRVAYKKLNLRHLSSVFPIHCLKWFWSSEVLSFKSMLFQGHCNFRSLEFHILSINVKYAWTEKENNDNVEW